MSVTKYQFALDASGEITSVHTLNRGWPRTPGEFRCLSCGNELIPKLGEIRTWHFAHKTTVDCSAETYLHRLGKAVFYREYQDCLRQRKPFRLRFPISRNCTHFQEQDGRVCDIGTVSVFYDLTRYFPRILPPETPDGAFVPDITLVSRDGKQRLYVEICVTHPASEEKVNSGTRILEIAVSGEEDLEAVRKHDLTAFGYSGVTVYNFNREVVQDFCGGACRNRRGGIFIVYESGLAVALIDSLHEIQRKLARNARLIVHTEPFNIPLDNMKFRALLSRAWEQGLPIKNCFLCRYHAQGRYETIFCKFLRRGGSSSEAAKCQYYRPDVPTGQ